MLRNSLRFHHDFVVMRAKFVENATLLQGSFATTHPVSPSLRLSFFTTTVRSFTMTSKRLTENQWKGLISAWIQYDNNNESPPTKKRKMSRKKFVENWCLDHGIPEDAIPHGSSVTRRIDHEVANAKHNENRTVQYYPLCGCVIDQMILDKVENEFGDTYKDVEYNDDMCINCNTKRFLQKKDMAADKYIHQHMLAKRGPIVNWSDAITVPKKNLPLRRMPPELLACPDFLEFQRKPIRYRTFACEDNNPTKMFASKISGGHHPPSFQYDITQIAENPQDGSIGLVLFGDGDFAMVDTSGISNETIYELSAQEQSSILDMESASRQGNAGGTFYFSENFDHDVRSLTTATKHSRVFIAKEEANSARLTVVYMNCAEGAPHAVKYGSVYNDVLMKRNDSIHKRANAMQSPYLREKYIAEMKSRLRCFCIMDYCGLKNVHVKHWDSFLSVLKTTKRESYARWRMCDSTLSLFECILLEWCCSTGEMRNHEALSVHKDANKSHCVETMMAFGRLDPTKSHFGKSLQVRFFRDAVLCALWQMLALRIKCGRDIWHVSLSNTFHLPDRSRDKHNVTWVHGP